MLQKIGHHTNHQDLGHPPTTLTIRIFLMLIRFQDIKKLSPTLHKEVIHRYQKQIPH